MTRRRAGTSTQVMTLYSGISSKTKLQKFLSCSHFSLSAALPYAGVETTIHPNYALSNGSVDNTKYLTTLGSSNSSGFFKNGIIRRAKYTFHVSNAANIPCLVNVCPIPWNSSGALGANYASRLDNREGCKSVLLNNSGVTGNTKTFSIIFDLSKIEGMNIQLLTDYWVTSTLRGAKYTNFYFQGYNLDLTSNVGLVLLVHAEYEILVMQENTTLNV